MKLSHLRRQKPELGIRVFRAKYPGRCLYCDSDYFGSEEEPGAVVVQWSNGVPRHYRCGMRELGVTQRENGEYL